MGDFASRAGLPERKEYLKPRPEVIVENKKMRQDWLDFEAHMKKNTETSKVFGRPYSHTYPQSGETVEVKDVDEVMNRIINMFSKPDSQMPQQQKDMMIEEYAQELIKKMLELNSDFVDRPEVFEYAIYKTVLIFVMSRFRTACKQANITNLKDSLINHWVNIFDRIHFALP